MAKLASGSQNNKEAAQRLDKWLWYARVVKTRTLASTLVQNGKVRVNRVRTNKPGHIVKINDVITVAVHRRVRVLKVLAPGNRRGSFVEAAVLLEDLSPAMSSASQATSSGAAAGEAPDTGLGRAMSGGLMRAGARPTKKDRRALDRLQRGTE